MADRKNLMEEKNKNVYLQSTMPETKQWGMG